MSHFAVFEQAIIKISHFAVFELAIIKISHFADYEKITIKIVILLGMLRQTASKLMYDDLYLIINKKRNMQNI